MERVVVEDPLSRGGHTHTHTLHLGQCFQSIGKDTERQVWDPKQHGLLNCLGQKKHSKRPCCCSPTSWTSDPCSPDIPRPSSTAGPSGTVRPAWSPPVLRSKSTRTASSFPAMQATCSGERPKRVVASTRAKGFVGTEATNSRMAWCFGRWWIFAWVIGAGGRVVRLEGLELLGSGTSMALFNRATCTSKNTLMAHSTMMHIMASYPLDKSTPAGPVPVCLTAHSPIQTSLLPCLAAQCMAVIPSCARREAKPRTVKCVAHCLHLLITWRMGFLWS